MTFTALLERDKKFMKMALMQADIAQSKGEVPIGCAISIEDECIALSHNLSIAEHDPTAHAEMLALKEAAQRIKNHRLAHATLYVTLEPCMMCLGALIQARIQRLVYAAEDQRVGIISTHQLHQLPHLNHRITIEQGPYAQEAAQILRQFFREKR